MIANPHRTTPETPHANDELLTIVEVANLIRVPVATLRYYRHLGCGPRSFKVGRTVRKVRGYDPQFATCAETGTVLFSRLRGGTPGAARGAKSFLTEMVSRVRDAGATGQLTVRAESACGQCVRTVLSTAGPCLEPRSSSGWSSR